MIVNLKYENSQYFVIKRISVIGLSGNFNPEKNTMRLRNGFWETEIELPPGEHRYKFLINGEIKLNDPLANIYYPDDKEELWSVIIINEQEKRLYNNEQYTVNLESYALTNNVSDKPVAINKHSFNKTTDKKAVARFEFNNITGLHSVTAVWYDPFGRVYEYTENNLYSDGESSGKSVYLWFWINLVETGRECPDGNFTIKLFVDGSFILEDRITITRAITYSANGYYSTYM